ncbi:hypothetical protein X922_16575 [Pseudomonas aeruginosa VRFPA08]|nr:hypothetical protein X922_16575 [Pseudomonas aeruginosa VRFPA08]
MPNSETLPWQAPLQQVERGIELASAECLLLDG